MLDWSLSFFMLPKKYTDLWNLLQKQKSYFFGYLDKSWADDFYNQRSTAKYIFILNGSPISWNSQKQYTVSTFTCKTEYIT